MSFKAQDTRYLHEPRVRLPHTWNQTKTNGNRNISDQKEERNKRNERRPEASLRAQTPGTLNFSMKNAEARALLDSRRSVFIRKPTKRC